MSFKRLLQLGALLAVVVIVAQVWRIQEAKAQHAELVTRMVSEMTAVTGGMNTCVTKPLAVDALALTSGRAFVMNVPDFAQGYGIATVFVAMTDANASITRLDITCTDSNNGSTSDYVPQVCDDTSDGICVQTDAGVWRKTVTGTKLYSTRMDIEGVPSTECTVSVGAGSATASVDLLTVGYTLCVKG